MRGASAIAALIGALSLGGAPRVVVLDVADRPQAAEAPSSGWCGETAIQEALLHRGAWVSQRAIHDAGKSIHPDLYSRDVPVALASLGVVFDVYGATKGSASGGFAGFLRSAIDAGDPVIAGVKILPTEHPDWALDHFVLAIGYGPKGILVNTTWNEQRWIADGATKGISLDHAFYGLRIRGVAAPKGRASIAAQVAVVTEGSTSVQLLVRCPSVPTEGSLLERRDVPTADAAAESWPLTAKSPSKSLSIPRAKAAWFRCAPLAKP